MTPALASFDLPKHKFSNVRINDSEYVAYCEIPIAGEYELHFLPVAVKLGFVKVYEVKLASVDGVSLGYVIETKAPTKNNGEYFIAAKRIPSLSVPKFNAECKYIVSHMLIFTYATDLVIFVSDKTNSTIAKMLDA